MNKTAEENNQNFPFVRQQNPEMELRPMRSLRDIPDADYLVWGSESHPQEVTKGQLI